MPGPIFWIFIGVLIALLGLIWLGIYIWERYWLTPQQRWQRKYDRKMKNFFKGI
jgi:uncharacterized membrane protein